MRSTPKYVSGLCRLLNTRFVRYFCGGLSDIVPRLGITGQKVQRWLRVPLYAPEPTEDIGRHDGNTSSRCGSGERLLRAGFTVCEAVAADHDGD